MILERNCDRCGESYLADSKYLNRGQGVFCSRSCAQRRGKTEPKPNTSCNYCGKPLYRKASLLARTSASFCSREHQGLSSQTESGVDYHTGPLPGSGVRRVTGSRKCPFPDCDAWTPALYGCRKHSSALRTQGLIDKWLAGDVSATWAGPDRTVKVFVKRYLIQERGGGCEDCGFAGKNPDGRSIIQMDHVDGDYTNNLIENLRLLCPNCHAMTPTYGSRNARGRTFRKRYYSKD